MARESIYQVVVLCNLIVTTAWITRKIETTAVIERPFDLAIGTLLLCSFVWFVVDKWTCGRRDSSIPLGRKDDVYSNLESEGEGRSQSSKWSRFFSIGRGSIGSVVLHVVLRILMIRWIRGQVQCSWNGVELFLPLWLLVTDPLNGLERKKVSHLEYISKLKESNLSRHFYLLVVWALSTYMTISLTAHNSNYICPAASKWKYQIRFYQCIGVGLDAGILLEVSKIAQGLGQSSGRSWGVLSKIALISATALGFIGSAFIWKNLHQMIWSSHIDHKTKAELLYGILACTNWIWAVAYLLHELRPWTIVFIVGCVSSYASQISVWPSQIMELSSFHSKVLVVVCLSGFGSMAGLIRAERDASRSQRQLSLQRDSVRMLTSLVFLIGSGLIGSAFMLRSRSNAWSNHPIDLLITQAKTISSQWEAQAGGSKTLSEAIIAYQARYGIYPPPNFDKWYNFAVERKSAIIDDFDQIHNDLLPFWGMEPAEIRWLTTHMLDRPWTSIAGVRILNGTANIGPHMPPTHRWMIDGTVDMLNKFIQWLPDMDLAFNINDESRVAVPWSQMEKLKQAASVAREEFNKTRVKVRPSFFPHVVDTWEDGFMGPEPPNQPDVPSEFFEDASFTSSFDHYGSIGCPPDSLSRQQHWPNKKSFCRHCPSPHLLGPFVKDWALSGSVCHQPDIANLHGFHLSPAAFRSTNRLFPVFSQSKLPTFNDIVFPSPWNYRDKVVYDDQKDIPFLEKQNTSFWRGATSEGFSKGGLWQGMQRQRFVHLVTHTPNFTAVDLLLPQGNQFTSQVVSLSDIRASTSIDVGFVDAATRCGSRDCGLQNREFKFGSPVDFQDHWKYKYLFDFDGAGFSGRFLPFLRSHSLVFRAAVFRQWFDERLVAWKHFVPVDGRLHDVWGLLAYFGGIGPKANNSHQLEAERIATDGREWAKKVLRKDDMEVYMFRLLLEWGRIVDDRRSQLGFSLAAVP